MEGYIFIPDQGLGPFFRVPAQAPDQAHGIRSLEDFRAQATGPDLQARNFSLQEGSGSAMIIMGMGEEQVAEVAGITQVGLQLFEVGGPHEGHARLKKGRLLPQ